MAEIVCAQTRGIAAWREVAVICIIAVGLVTPALCADEPVGENRTTGKTQKSAATDKPGEPEKIDQTRKTVTIQPGIEAVGTQVDLTKLSVEQLMNVEVSMKQVLSTQTTVASKTPEKVSDSPVPVFVITRTDIQRFGYRTLEEALKRISSVYTSTSRVFGFLGVRGFNRPNDFNTRVLLLVNGHRVNELAFNYAGIQEDFPVDLENVERIEFVKGPGSALWGADAMLAVVNVVVRNAEQIQGLEAVAQYGSENRLKGLLSYGNVFPSGLGIVAHVSALNSAGQDRLFMPQWASFPERNYGWSVGCDGLSTQRVYLSADYKGLYFFVARTERVQAKPLGSDTVFNDPWQRDFEIFQPTELGYRRTVSPARKGEFLLRLYYDYYHAEDFFLEDEGGPTPRRVHVFGGNKDCGTELRYSQDLSRSLSAMAGLEYARLYQSSNPQARFSLFSYYLQTDLKMPYSLRMVAGIRSDSYSKYGTAWSPRVTLMRSFSESSIVRLIYGTAFRAPMSFEQQVNPNVQPETIATYELSWEQKLGKYRRLVTSLFVDDLMDLIDAETGQNGGRIVSRGVDVQLQSIFPNGALGNVGLSLLKATDRRTNQWVDYSPKFVATAGYSLPVLSQRLYVTAELNYVGNRLDSQRSIVPGSAITNLVLRTGNLFEKLVLTFGIYNLFNKTRYNPVMTELVWPYTYMPEDTRTVQFQADYHF